VRPRPRPAPLDARLTPPPSPHPTRRHAEGTASTRRNPFDRSPPGTRSGRSSIGGVGNAARAGGRDGARDAGRGGAGRDGGDARDGQRERSIAMVNEGLEGLFPRASQLLQLGGSVFLAFVPFIVTISALFAGIYFVFGDSFVHGGEAGRGLPAYIDAEALLAEPTVDPRIPYM
jgi:hypothetical protein